MKIFLVASEAMFSLCDSGERDASLLFEDGAGFTWGAALFRAVGGYGARA